MACIGPVCTVGPMKEKDLTPGTVYPVMGNLLFFLPQRYKEKLCCITPLGQRVKVVIPQSKFTVSDDMI